MWSGTGDLKINVSNVSLSYSLSPSNRDESFLDDAPDETNTPLSEAFLDMSFNTPNHRLSGCQTDSRENCADTSSSSYQRTQFYHNLNGNSDSGDGRHRFSNNLDTPVDTSYRNNSPMSSLSLSGTDRNSASPDALSEAFQPWDPNRTEFESEDKQEQPLGFSASNGSNGTTGPRFAESNGCDESNSSMKELEQLETPEPLNVNNNPFNISDPFESGNIRTSHDSHRLSSIISNGPIRTIRSTKLLSSLASLSRPITTEPTVPTPMREPTPIREPTSIEDPTSIEKPTSIRESSSLYNGCLESNGIHDIIERNGKDEKKDSQIATSSDQSVPNIASPCSSSIINDRLLCRDEDPNVWQKVRSVMEEQHKAIRKKVSLSMLSP